jgi:hypothetical protein
MRKKEKFNETVGILVDAYINNTLVHGHPCGCAVGNLIARKLNIKIRLVGDTIPVWDGPGSGFSWFKRLYPDKVASGDVLEGVFQIDMTGYSVDEIVRIESAFESTCQKGSPGNIVHDSKLDPDGYRGLMEVVDVLADIHGIDLSERETAKLLFSK